jgi:hypothetical protein
MEKVWQWARSLSTSRYRSVGKSAVENRPWAAMKTILVIRSCWTWDHYKLADRMADLFFKKFGREVWGEQIDGELAALLDELGIERRTKNQKPLGG